MVEWTQEELEWLYEKKKIPQGFYPFVSMIIKEYSKGTFLVQSGSCNLDTISGNDRISPPAPSIFSHNMRKIFL